MEARSGLSLVAPLPTFSNFTVQANYEIRPVTVKFNSNNSAWTKAAEEKRKNEQKPHRASIFSSLRFSQYVLSSFIY